MKKTMMILAVGLAGAQAQADGFRCETADGSLALAVYNKTQPEEGTRNGAILVLSDPAVKQGRKTIAKFTDAKGTLTNRGASYEADVDLRVAESRRKGERLLGTRLGELDRILVEVAFTYASPVEEGEELDGSVTAIKRNGDVVEAELICARYLKSR